MYPDYPPRALAAEKIDDRHQTRALAFVNLNNSSAIMPSHFEDGWTPLNSADIERCIAKIALCEAVRSIDTRVRDAAISRFILEGETDTSDFLGARPSHEITDDMHRVAHQKLVSRTSDAVAILTTVNLFNWLPTPSYQVVIRPDAEFQFPQMTADKV